MEFRRQLVMTVEIAKNTWKYVCRGKEPSAMERKNYEKMAHKTIVNKYKVTTHRT
jgi:hypothetical protein